MGEAYPELRERAEAVAETLAARRRSGSPRRSTRACAFSRQHIGELEGRTVIGGELVFQLYDTYGFPFDLTADIARERDLDVDAEGFEQAMAAQRERARAASQFGNVDTADAISGEALAALGGEHLLRLRRH